MISSLISSLADTPLPKSPPSEDFWMPIEGSTFAVDVDWLYNVLFWLSAASALAIFAVMFHFVRKYRVASRDDSAIGEELGGHHTALEITWSVIPLFIVIALFVWGFKGFVDIRTPPKDALEIHAQGQKWKWLFTYNTPAGSYTDSELHVPVDRDVRIIIQSADVLHSLFLPAIRVKMDAVPGRYTDLWFHATKVGSSPVFCAEYCGTSHSDMITQLVVHEPGGYEAFLQKAEDLKKKLPPAELGKMLYSQQGCETCHSTDGSTKVGPTWKGMYGHEVQFADGTSGTVDENYLRESINQPQAKIVAGFAPSMPTYQGKLADYEINGLIEFIKSLK
jgi:cytochrome c oxidase subunit 2